MKKRVFASVCAVVVGSAAILALLLVGLDDRLPVLRADAVREMSINASVNAFKIASAETARPGDLITYTIVMYNNDLAEAVDVLMVDEIPAHTVYVTHTMASRVATSGTVQLPGTGSLALMDFIFLRTTLGERGTAFPPWVTLATLTVRVQEDAPVGSIVNTARFWVGDEPQYFVRQVETTIRGGKTIFLPIVMRRG
jgi:uncharacterized repeat protein (TIGR01451 family)